MKTPKLQNKSNLKKELERRKAYLISSWSDHRRFSFWTSWIWAWRWKTRWLEISWLMWSIISRWKQRQSRRQWKLWGPKISSRLRFRLYRLWGRIMLEFLWSKSWSSFFVLITITKSFCWWRKFKRLFSKLMSRLIWLSKLRSLRNILWWVGND